MEIVIFFLKLSAAVPMLVFGIHQLQNPMAWSHNLPSFLRNELGETDTKTFMEFHSVANIALSVWLISGFTLKLSALVVLLWYLALTPFVWQQKWSNGVRDLSIAFAVFALFLLA